MAGEALAEDSPMDSARPRSRIGPWIALGIGLK